MGDGISIDKTHTDKSNKINFYVELIFIVILTVTLINAIIKSIELIHLPINISFFHSTLMQTNGGLLIHLILILSMMFAIAGIIFSFISFTMLNSKGHNIKQSKQFSNFKNLIIIIASLTNIFVLFFISKLGEIQFDFKQAIFLQIFSLIISIIFMINIKLRNKNFIKK